METPIREKTILETTQTHTPSENVICDTFIGNYTLLCVKYADSPVRLQVKPPHESEWQNAVFAGIPVTLTEVGDAINLPITPCYGYRVVVDTAGAMVVAIPDPD